jgi:hypothetical protein
MEELAATLANLEKLEVHVFGTETPISYARAWKPFNKPLL